MESQSIVTRVVTAYDAFVRSASALQSPFLLAVRLYWGWQFLGTGWGKLHHLAKITSFFASLGIPAPALSAFSVSWLELIGGVLLIVGFGSRFTGLLLGVDMIVAYLTAGRANLLSIFSDPGKFYSDDAYTFLFASVLILIFGPGKYCLDELLKRRALTDADPSRASMIGARSAPGVVRS